MNFYTKKDFLIIALFAFLALLILNYDYLDSKITGFLTEDSIIISRVIDGDTVEAGEKTIRLLGINSPEKGELYYEQSKNFLEDLILNKSVRLVYSGERKDQYQRTLAYIYYQDENINLKLVEKGLANYYFPSAEDDLFGTFLEAWKSCIEENINLCEASTDKCTECIFLKKLDEEKESIVVQNLCPFECDLSGWTIKDEGRKKYTFQNYQLPKYSSISIIVGSQEDREDILYWSKYDYVWTDSGDTLFLRDKTGKLVLWEYY
jgi:hypothetical protein